jgi:hypothetical protein
MNMEYFWYAVIAGAAILSLVVIRRRHAEYRSLLHEQALKRRGKLKSGFLTSPKLLFNHKGNNILIDSSRGGYGSRIAYTRARSSFVLTIDGKLTVGTEPPGAAISKWLGMQDIEIGNTEFDDEFLIKSDQESFAREFLTPEVRRKLLDLGNLYLQVRRGELVLYIWYLLYDSMGYDNFVDTVIVLLENAKRLGPEV